MGSASHLKRKLQKEILYRQWQGKLPQQDSAAFRDTWYVDNGSAGSDSNDGRAPKYPLSTVTQANTNASAGDTVIIRGYAKDNYSDDYANSTDNATGSPYAATGTNLYGIYNEAVNFSTDYLTVIGYNWPLLIGAGENTADDVSAPAVKITGRHVTVENLYMIAPGNTTHSTLASSDQAGILQIGAFDTAVEDYHYVTVDNCIFNSGVGSSDCNYATAPLFAVRNFGAQWFTFKNSIIYKGTYQYVFSGSSTHNPQRAYIENCKFIRPGTNSIYCHTAGVNYSQIKDCEFIRAADKELILTGTGYNKVVGCTFGLPTVTADGTTGSEITDGIGEVTVSSETGWLGFSCHTPNGDAGWDTTIT